MVGAPKHKSLTRRVAARYLSAAPLDDFHSLGPVRGQYTTVGWGLERVQAKIEKATSFFQSRKDSWAIIVKPGEFSDSLLQAYVDKNPKLKRSKIIVVSTSAMEGDFTAPEWVVVHDIVGHSIVENQGAEMRGEISRAFHKALPKKFQISSNSNDVEADIYAAIFFYALPKDFVKRAAEISLEMEFGSGQYSAERLEERIFDYQDEYELLLRDVALWSSKFRPGVPRWVKPW